MIYILSNATILLYNTDREGNAFDRPREKRAIAFSRILSNMKGPITIRLAGFFIALRMANRAVWGIPSTSGSPLHLFVFVTEKTLVLGRMVRL